ncbi:exodeoxyribonuclease III [Pseudochelatococcus lubricantis]|uniref:exodeoxyribonuclease III n=1 Tax=Pseudochelatococcus lubricantis TaxID=1538102 RepID=UPI0014205A95|nr:exodeoxyribonuclease III [Pseudochelatococcus lubricantis]
MRIATWNINSVRLRIDHLTAFLDEAKPDILCLQEIKCVDDAFPRAQIEDKGYNVAVNGQKTFNGVAIVSRLPLEDVTRGLPGDDGDEQARYIEAVVSVKTGAVRVASLYLPNGNPPDSEKYPYKLKWLDRLADHARTLLALEEPFALAGDYNVIPQARDAAHPEQWTGDALYLPQSRAKFQSLLNLGLTEAVRACDDRDGLYTFWDYQAGAWQKNNGIRIDHLLLSPQAADHLKAAHIHKQMRAHEKPSDHVPVSIDLDL